MAHLENSMYITSTMEPRIRSVNISRLVKDVAHKELAVEALRSVTTCLDEPHIEMSNQEAYM